MTRRLFRVLEEPLGPEVHYPPTRSEVADLMAAAEAEPAPPYTEIRRNGRMAPPPIPAGDDDA